MEQLIFGIVLFFGIHSISIIAMPLRDNLAAKSDIGWKLFYSLISVIGIVLVVKGYVALKVNPTILYTPLSWMRYVGSVLLLPAFILFLAPYIPGKIKNSVRNPQLLSIVLWAAAHLLMNGALADVMLFGSFLLWSIADSNSMNSRATRPVSGMPPTKLNDLVLIVLGLGLYVTTLFWLHGYVSGVKLIF